MRQQTIITGGAIYSKVCFRESVVSRRDPWDACISDSKIVKRDLGNFYALNDLQSLKFCLSTFNYFKDASILRDAVAIKMETKTKINFPCTYMLNMCL